MRHSRTKLWLIVFFITTLLLVLWRANAFEVYSSEQQLTLLLFGIAIYFWTISKMPFAASSLLLLGFLLTLRLVDEPQDAFRGLVSNALYFILVLSLILKALVSAGADRVFVGILMKLSRGGIRMFLFGLPLLIAFMPIILPSAGARLRILEPIIEQINVTFNLGEKSLFRKFSMYVIGMMNQNSTMVVFTRGGFPILAAQLLKTFGGIQLSWIGWFVRIAPPFFAFQNVAFSKRE